MNLHLWEPMRREPTEADLAWAVWCEEIKREQDDWIRNQFAELRAILTGEKMSQSKRRPKSPIATGERGRYQTRSGFPVTVLKTSCNLPSGDTIIGLIHYEGHDEHGLWQTDGSWRVKEENAKDLMETVESGTVERFINYYQSPERVGGIYKSRHEAVNNGNGGQIVLPIQVPTHDRIVIVK